MTLAEDWLKQVVGTNAVALGEAGAWAGAAGGEGGDWPVVLAAAVARPAWMCPERELRPLVARLLDGTLSRRGLRPGAELLIDVGEAIRPGRLAAALPGRSDSGYAPDQLAVGVARYTDDGRLILFPDTDDPELAGNPICCCADAVPLGAVIGVRSGWSPPRWERFQRCQAAA